jgi:hypothetical protein
MALKVVEMGTYHAQMGRSMAHIAHRPGPVCLKGGVSRWLVRVVGLGAELHQRPHTARGAHLQIDWRIETRDRPAPPGLTRKAWAIDRPICA